jgi:hypothetical protein
MINWRRLARMAGFALLAVGLAFVILHVLAAWVYAYAVLHVGCQGDRASLEAMGYQAEAVTFPSRNPDGPMLRGWFTQGSTHPEIVIITMPGHGGNTSWALLDAAIHVEAGYSSLIFEHRSCADPALMTSTGYYEAQDVLGAVDYLLTRSDIEHIAAHGSSAGGTASLLAAAQEPAIEAVISMGGYTSLEDDILDPSYDHTWYDYTLRRLILWSVNTQLGVPASELNPGREIPNISPRPVFLIYGEYESGEGKTMYALAEEPKELWIVPGSEHSGYAYVAPEEYRERVIAFFDSVFLED